MAGPHASCAIDIRRLLAQKSALNGIPVSANITIASIDGIFFIVSLVGVVLGFFIICLYPCCISILSISRSRRSIRRQVNRVMPAVFNYLLTVMNKILISCILYLDGAHTDDSLAACGSWYESCVSGVTRSQSDDHSPHIRILLFNCRSVTNIHLTISDFKSERSNSFSKQ
jgi:hypothetical protein